MKKQIIFVLFMLFAGTAVVNAQGQGPQRRTVEERVKMTMEKVTPALSLDKTQESRTDSVFTDYYKAIDKVRESMQPGTPPDRTAWDKIVSDRDERLKTILTADQFKKFKDEVEPNLRPQRRPNGGQ